MARSARTRAGGRGQLGRELLLLLLVGIRRPHHGAVRLACAAHEEDDRGHDEADDCNDRDDARPLFQFTFLAKRLVTMDT